MSVHGNDQHLTLLQRIDLAIASRVAQRRESVDLARPEDLQSDALLEHPVEDSEWIGRVLGLRGFEVRSNEVEKILATGDGPDIRADQETRLIWGMSRVLRSIRQSAVNGNKPDGWMTVGLFRELTGEIARFRGNALRRDQPWDGIPGVRYPDSDAVPELLEGFCAAKHYGETEKFRSSTHPVRRAVRMLWRFARIAPFPDFNTVMGVVVMNAYLLAKGYPMVAPSLPEDRDILTQMVAGPPPKRLVQFESRLVETLGA